MWAGHRTVLAGDHAVRVGWDDAATAAALREAIAAWPDALELRPLPVSFGVRSVAVGLLRRRMWLVHHGTPVRHRADDLPAACRFVQGLLEEIAGGAPGDDEVVTTLRAYVSGGRAVLVHIPDDVDLDERPLRKRGIEQLPRLSAIVRAAPARVVQGDRSYSLCGVVVDARLVGQPASTDDARRHVLALASGDRIGWAWALDRLGDAVVVSSDVGSVIRRLLA